MVTRINPYLSFRDEARDAMEFYRSVFGGDLSVSTFAEFHAGDTGEENKVMHAALETPDGLVLMGADTPNSMELPSSSRISVSLSGEDENQLRGYWDKLSDGGQVTMPFERAPWGDLFGMCLDKYGIAWMVDGGSGQAETDGGSA